MLANGLLRLIVAGVTIRGYVVRVTSSSLRIKGT